MIKCIAVDDSPLALDLLEDYISQVDFLVLERRCSSAIEAAEILHKGKIDLMFLDIQMPDFSGLDLLKSLDKKCKVILTTSFTQYAVEGFNLEVTDYLLKPFSFDRFLKAVNKVKANLKSEDISGVSLKEKDDKYIFIKSGYDSVKIFLNDILYIEALKDYVQVFTPAGKVLSLMSMGEILAELPEDEFIRVHRSYIVPFSKISLISPRKIFIGQKEIPLGEVFRTPFFDKVNRKK